ncbi:hypothetical protein [Nocardioides coralli]|uniref:hypothetical protein n=1 Tax=Nocardioides coralli TaxID=2872154 RepID=UPI001CA44987|nr:hypothetical protein [Nocardioides coralli]QZY28821.1 hypothetical protein K6T13_15420 [Nocardioides coralli]
MRNRWWAVVAVVAVLALLAGVAWWWRTLQQNDFQRAISWAPPDAQRLTFTDWGDVRRELGVEIAADAPSGEVSAFMTRAFDRDLSSMSALPESTEVMHERFGFSPATLDWELLSQSQDGAVVVMRVVEGTDFEELADRLEGLGYQRPEDEDGVWVGGIDLLPRIGTLTPELQFLALDEGQRVVVSSDTQGYLEQALPAVTGGEGGLDGLDEVVDASGEPLAAAVFDGEVVCGRLAMGSAGDSDQDQADQLIAAAGRVDPLTGFAMSAQPGGGVRVAMSFESDEQARANADSRARLASGPAPGQGGDFADRFTLGRVTAEGSVVTMRLDPLAGSYVLSDLSSGPVLFATC